VYRTQEFSGGAYVGYRTDDRAIVAGVDGLVDHWPWPRTQVGFNAEYGLTTINNDDGRHNNRGVIFGRYVFQYGSSLYLPPMDYFEIFGGAQHDALPLPRNPVPGTNHFDDQTMVGLHYHLDYLTPYWDPEGGLRFDGVYTNGLPIFGEHEPFYAINGQFSFVKGLPDWLGPLSQTRLAARIYGAAALPNNGEIYTMGGGDLFRGFDLSQRQGNLVWVGSLEWRIPVIRRVNWDVCDHVAGVRNVSLAAFYDIGDAYVSGHSMGPVAHALGGGLRVDIAWLSLIERMTLRLDVAQTINASSPTQFWFGVRVPF
jgi:Omp85 superfamily domain